MKSFWTMALDANNILHKIDNTLLWLTFSSDSNWANHDELEWVVLLILNKQNCLHLFNLSYKKYKEMKSFWHGVNNYILLKYAAIHRRATNWFNRHLRNAKSCQSKSIQYSNWKNFIKIYKCENTAISFLDN